MKNTQWSEWAASQLSASPSSQLRESPASQLSGPPRDTRTAEQAAGRRQLDSTLPVVLLPYGRPALTLGIFGGRPRRCDIEIEPSAWLNSSWRLQIERSSDEMAKKIIGFVRLQKTGVWPLNGENVSFQRIIANWVQPVSGLTWHQASLPPPLTFKQTSAIKLSKLTFPLVLMQKHSLKFWQKCSLFLYAIEHQVWNFSFQECLLRRWLPDWMESWLPKLPIWPNDSFYPYMYL